LASCIVRSYWLYYTLTKKRFEYVYYIHRTPP
jgi:hypothetical protein